MIDQKQLHNKTRTSTFKDIQKKTLQQTIRTQTKQSKTIDNDSWFKRDKQTSKQKNKQKQHNKTKQTTTNKTNRWCN